MQLTKEQYQKIEMYLPKQRGNVKISNLQMLNAMLYMAEEWMQVAGLTVSFWKVAFDLHANESLGEERRSGQSV